MTEVIKLPSLNECYIDSGYDLARQKNWILLRYENVAIKEYFDVKLERYVLQRMVNKMRGKIALMLMKNKRREQTLRIAE